MTHKLDRLPEAKPLLLKAAATITRKPKGNIVIPALSVEVQGVRADPARLAAYAELCGFAPADTLPITFPQVQAASLHMWLMTQPEFPLSLLGIVHLRNTFRQAAPLPADAAYTYTLRSRIQDLDRLLEHAGVTGDVTLAVHDWGGMIGFGWALSAPGPRILSTWPGGMICSGRLASGGRLRIPIGIRPRGRWLPNAPIRRC